MNDTNEPDDLKRSAPTLFGLPKADPFVVPEGFFDRFPHEVQGLVTAKKHRGVNWSAWKRTAIALPALALLGLGVWWATRPSPQPDHLAALTGVSLTDGELDALGDDELAALTEEVIPLVEPEQALGQVGIRLNDDELIAYFEGEGVDMNELITTE
jgi:hypothetical protein